MKKENFLVESPQQFEKCDFKGEQFGMFAEKFRNKTYNEAFCENFWTLMWLLNFVACLRENM